MKPEKETQSARQKEDVRFAAEAVHLADHIVRGRLGVNNAGEWRKVGWALGIVADGDFGSGIEAMKAPGEDLSLRFANVGRSDKHVCEEVGRRDGGRIADVKMIKAEQEESFGDLSTDGIHANDQNM
jgi:hypothetical protein